MVMTLRKRAPAPPPPPRSPSPDPQPIKKKAQKPKARKRAQLSDSETDSDSVSESEPENLYESVREQRIRENRERMEKLGILNLSSQMFNSKNKISPKRRVAKSFPKKKTRGPPLVPRPPSRNSDRLNNARQYSFLQTEGILEDVAIFEPEGYTEEHEKLLGDCETKWTLDVDGTGEDGERLYDPANGTSCHQCRQKTLRKHTYCGKCRSGQGRLCGDCLYTRYGENVLEAQQNPTWLCPACRGICNCSRCRREKGWQPVTITYQKVTELGYKSVAHYLILKRRAGNIQMKSEDGTVMVDLTECEAPAPLHYDCSDTSADWSESDSDDSDDDDSNTCKTKTAPVENQVDISQPEAWNEAAGSDKNEVLPSAVLLAF